MIESILQQLTPRCVAACDPARTGLKCSVFLEAAEIVRAARLLLEAEYFLEDLTAIDAKEGYLVVYHFDHMDRPGRMALRVLVPHDNPKLPSIASVYQGAEWHERETRDFYGLEFVGNPNLVPLLLDPDAGVHPLQKEAGARAWLADLLTPCEVVRAEAGFDLLTPKAEEGGKKAAAEAGTESE